MRIRLKNFRCYTDSTFDFGKGKVALLSGPSGQGKCLGKNTPILMYNGKIKMSQHIVVGDLLMGDDSSPRKVISICNGIDRMYKIVPLKGNSYVVNSGHILTLLGDIPKLYLIKNKGWGVRYSQNGLYRFKYFSTEQEAIEFCNELSTIAYDISLEDYMKLPLSSQMYNYTFHTGVSFPSKILEIDPYWFGIWLGNEKEVESIISINDNFVEEYMKKFRKENSFLKRHNYMDYKMNNSIEWINKLKEQITKYNLIKNKHIPHKYKTSSRKQRLALLAGLVDSKGKVVNNVINIIEKNKKLAEDISFLALSLGFMAIKSHKYKNSIFNKKVKYYNVCIYGDDLEEIPSVLIDNQVILKKHIKRSTAHKFKIVPQGQGEYFGFEIDGNGRFLLGDFKVTHNSSILMGIYFALFGTGTKVTAYGKTSCSVELEFDGMKVVRNKRPNRLIVNDVYEDASAQEIINRKFGNTFDVTGYITQNAINSFILMSPNEKLSFLEKFAFRDVDLGKIKGRCKAHITKCNEALIAIVSQLSMARCVLDGMDKPDEVKFPLKCKKSQREKAIKNENIRYKNCITLIRRTEKKLKSLSNEINDLRVLEATLHSRKETYDELVVKLKKLEAEIDNNNYEGDDKLIEYEKRLEALLAKRKLYAMEEQLENDKATLEEMRNKEITVLLEEQKNIDASLWKEYTKSELKSNMSELKQCLADLEKVEFLRKEMKKCEIDLGKHKEHKKELEQYTKNLEDKKQFYDNLVAQQDLYSCPKCLAKLRFLDKNLILIDNVVNENNKVNIHTVKEEINIIKHTISKLQHLISIEENKLDRSHNIKDEINNILISYEEIPKIDEIREDLEYLRKYQAINSELENKKLEIIRKIEQEKLSSSYTTFKDSVEKLYREVIFLKKKSGDAVESMEEDDLRIRIIDQKQIRDKLSNLELQRKKLEENRDKCEDILNQAKSKYIEKYGSVSDKQELEKKIKIEEKNIIEQENKRNNHHTILNNIKEWERYQQELDNYQVWEKKIENLEQQEKKSRNEYAAATQLKDKILEAESIAMINIVESINTHARIYLDSFFQEHPISVQLQPFKQTKKTTKPAINIMIEYKGMEADLNMLSGGELSRVILAYTLALAEMFNTPLILLDECTASLDQDLTSTVFDSIRENFNGKMALIIAHQVVTGTFDKTICLGRDEIQSN